MPVGSTPHVHCLKGHLSKRPYNALRGPPQPHVPQSYPPTEYNNLDKVNKKGNHMERMFRECKDSDEIMMKTMSKQFVKLAMSNREKGVTSS